MNTADVIDQAAGLAPGQPLFEARRLRAKVVEATQASHDAIVLQPVDGLGVADRLRVAVACCEAGGDAALARHYRALLDGVSDMASGNPPDASPTQPAPALAAMQRFAVALTTDPRRGDRAAIEALRAAGLSDAAIVALAQLVAFLSYQTRVVVGLSAMHLTDEVSDSTTRSARDERPSAAPAAAPEAAPLIRRNGFTNETLDWQSWLAPVELAQASALQQAVLDESHPQARSSPYYRTLVHQPQMLRHRSAAYNAIMYAPGGAPRAERELGAMVVSVTNGCVYCTSVHAQRFAQLARRHDTVEQVFANPASAGTTERERAIARFAQALTLRPQALAAADLADLRAQGMDDAQTIDLLHAVAIFGWANRLMHNLGEPVPAGTA